jgi:hypothetical protein
LLFGAHPVVVDAGAAVAIGADAVGVGTACHGRMLKVLDRHSGSWGILGVRIQPCVLFWMAIYATHVADEVYASGGEMTGAAMTVAVALADDSCLQESSSESALHIAWNRAVLIALFALSMDLQQCLTRP